jgi:hypothetical protein
LRRAHLAVRDEGLAGIITFHTHPRSTSEVRFSAYDDQQDPMLIENLQEIWPPTLLTSIVMGERSQCGRVWMSGSDQSALTELVCVGQRLQYLPLDGMPAPPAPKPAAIFDRAIALPEKARSRGCPG